MEIKGTTAIVTGGASGLGRDTSVLLNKLGARVVVADVQDEKGEALEAELGPSAAFAHVDVCNTEQVQAAVDLAIRRFGRIDILVNCAGISTPGRTASVRGPLDLDQFKHVINVNLVGTFDFVRLCSSRMLNNEPNDEGERGVIVNTASVAAFDCYYGTVAYTASKAAVVSMTLTIARDLGAYGIRTCTIAPGSFRTPQMMHYGSTYAEFQVEHNAFPRRLGRPEEFARLVQHIVENVMLNGETIRLDAGQHGTPRYNTNRGHS